MGIGKRGVFMELRVLNYFLVVAQEENITKASKLLHVSQPTLSRQLMQLEEELGVSLFKRSNHSIVLTNEGRMLKRRAQEMVSLADKTIKELSESSEELSGEISIGCSELQSMRELAEIMIEFQKKHPLISYEIYSGNTSSIKERMERGTLDIGLLIEPIDTDKYTYIHMKTKEEWGVLVSEEMELAKREVIHPKDLAGIPIITATSRPMRNELENWFGEYVDKIPQFSYYNLLYNSAVLAQKGAGVVLCLKLDANYEGLKFIPLAPKLELSSILAWKSHQTFSPATAAFIQFLQKYIN